MHIVALAVFIERNYQDIYISMWALQYITLGLGVYSYALQLGIREPEQEFNIRSLREIEFKKFYNKMLGSRVQELEFRN